MPNTLFLLDVRQADVVAELKLPVPEFQAALMQPALTPDSTDLLPHIRASLPGYIAAHLLVQTPDGQDWRETIGSIRVVGAEQEATGPFREVVVDLRLTPPAGASPRRFALHWDGIIHQVVTHKVLISLRRDWGGGKAGLDEAEVGYISLDPRDNSVPPLMVDLGESSGWRGFRSMVELGIHHISEGADHLLFLLVLLLPAPLLARGGRWGEAVGTRRAVGRLLKITLAFTLGHSLTLLAGTLGWMNLPSRPVEILIAASILVGALHALRPLFPGREAWIAAGFGLIHGLAFADILRQMELEGSRLTASLMGFNLGIEIAQLAVVFLVVPWLILLSQGKWYGGVRILGALVATVAALAWMWERISGKQTGVAMLVDSVASKGKWLVLGLAVAAIASHLVNRHPANRTV